MNPGTIKKSYKPPTGWKKRGCETKKNKVPPEGGRKPENEPDWGKVRLAVRGRGGSPYEKEEKLRITEAWTETCKCGEILPGKLRPYKGNAADLQGT